MDKFSEHKSQHITCGKQGCTFTGHPKIVEKHFMMQHRTGLFNRIVKGNSPEEIEKWITERKKHYPTKEKIEQKQAQRKEMEKRGERYAEWRKSFNQRNSNFKAVLHNRFNTNMGNKQPPFKSYTFGHRGAFTRNKSTDEGVEEQPKKRDPITIEDDDCVVRNLPSFRGTAYYLDLENNSEGDVALDDDRLSVISDFNENVEHEHEKSFDLSSENDEIEFPKSNDIRAENTDVKNSNSRSTIGENTNVNNTSENINSDTISNSAGLADQNIVKSTLSLNNSLALLQCYDSDGDSDQDDDTVSNNGNSCNTEATVASNINEPQKNYTDDESAPEECSSKGAQNNEEIKQVNSDNDEMKNENEKTYESKKRKRRRRKDDKNEDDDEASTEQQNPEGKMAQVFHTRKRYRPPTLLEKLLAPEIKHERNVILQCVRYVVENNYFNIDQPK